MPDDGPGGIGRGMSEREEGEHPEGPAEETVSAFRSLFENVPVGLYRSTADGHVLYANQAVAGMLGLADVASLKKMRIPDLYEDPADRARLIELADREGVVNGFEARLRRADGTTFDASISMRPMRTDRGVFYEGAVQDITARTLADETSRRTASLLQATLDSTADGILVVDSAGKISAFNRRFADLWRIPQEILDAGDDDLAIAHVLEQLNDPDSFVAKVRALYDDPRAESFDVLGFKDGRVFERYSAPQILDGEPVGRVWSFRDVSARNQVESELRGAEAKYRDLVERIPAVVYLAIYGEGAPWLYISPRVESMLGYTPDEWVEDPALWLKRLHPADRDRVMQEENLSRETGEPLVSEYRFVARDDHVVWVRDEAEVVRDERGTPVALRGLWYDITDEKQAEVALRSSEELVHRLFERLIDAQEEERARIAQDIHDDSIQVVTAVGLRLQTLRRSLTDPASIDQVEKLQATVEAAIARLRNLLFDLRPRALDEEGLAPALRLYLDRLEKQEEIETRLENRLVEDPPPDVRTALYRIAQEALVNARRHANATKIEVILEPRDGGFHVRVCDDGRGFDERESDPAEPGHLGLSSMRERAEMADGWLRVDSAYGRGTVVEFWLPARA